MKLTIFDLLGIDPPPDLTMWLDERIRTSTLEEWEKVEADSLNANSDTPEEVMEYVIQYVLANQLDPVYHGLNFNQSDMKRFLDKISPSGQH